MTEPDETVTTEWGLVLDGELGSLGTHYEMTGLTENDARDKLMRWGIYRADVKATLFRYEVRTIRGPREVVQP